MWILKNIICPVKILFVVIHLLGFFSERLEHLPRLTISIISCLIVVGSYLLALTTKKTVFI